MVSRPHPKRAETDASNPQAWATCGRCGFITNLVKLQWQMQWRGVQLLNTNLLVCEDCLDEPQRQLGTIILPPDPMSVANARPEQYAIDEYTYFAFEDGTPYPGADAGVRMQGEPIYLEESDQESQVPLILEIAQYYETT